MAGFLDTLSKLLITSKSAAMYKLNTLIAILKGLAILCCSFYEFVQFFFQVLNWIEAIPVIVVATWVLIMKLAIYLTDVFKIRLPFGLPKKAGKCTLKSVFWVSVFVCLAGLVSKCYYGITLEKLIVLIVAYAFLIYNDSREMKNVIDKIDQKP